MEIALIVVDLSERLFAQNIVEMEAMLSLGVFAVSISEKQ